MKSSKITARLLSAVLAIMMLFSLVTVGFTASAAKVDVAETGANISANTYFYFDNSISKFTKPCIQLMVGHSSWSQGYEMSKIAGTDIYCVKMPAWSGATQLCIFGTDSVWGGESSTISSRKSWAPESTGVYSLSSNASGSKLLYASGTSLKMSSLSAYSALNTAQTIVATVNGETVADAATFVIDSYNFTNATTVAACEGTTTVNAARTANVSMILDTVAAGYEFAGWSLDGTTVASEETAYEYVCDGTAKTVYALFNVVEVDPDAPEVPDEPVLVQKYDIPYADADGLYAYAILVSTPDELGANAWQRWTKVSDGRAFYLPATASAEEVTILNTYSATVKVNGVEIPAGEYRNVPYEAGKALATVGAGGQKVTVYNTDAEGTIFMNAQEGTTSKNDAGEKGTHDASFDLYAFMTSGTKNQETGNVGGAVASEADGLQENTTVKKLKGRGNSTWNLEKKPFNITYNDNIQIDGMKGKKWSLLANAQDASLLRNRLVYDLANEVGMVYACDSRFVDMFVDGIYKGSYQLTQKIEMGKNTVMPDLTEVEVDPAEEGYAASDFDFILELDTATNAANAGDQTFTTNRGQTMTHKVPDEPTDEQVAFMQAKYQALEDALYGDDLATLATLVDINDFARAYLVNEVAKNLDSGVTSCYFVYDNAKNIFVMSPVWDYDNALGNSVSIADRHDASGKTLDLTQPSGWYAKELMHYDSGFKGGRSVFSQACYMTSKTTDGKSFMDIVKEVWASDFADTAAVLAGTAEGTGRLQSAEDYISALAVSANWNYKMWTFSSNNGWISNHSSLVMYDYDAEANTLTSTTKKYDQDKFDGQANYAADWMISRINWISAQFNAAEKVVPEGYITVYFTNNWCFETQNIYYWGGTQAGPTWPGDPMNFVEINSNGESVYSADIPADVEGIIFTGISDQDHTTIRQTADIKTGIVNNAGFYCVTETNGKIEVGTYTYVPTTPVEPETTTEAPTDAPEVPSEEPTDAPEVTNDEPTVDPAPVTKTFYFSNNKWWSGDIYAYYWYEASAYSLRSTTPTWPGEKMTFVETNDMGEDIYKIEVPADIDNIIFNANAEGCQTADIPVKDVADGTGFYVTDEEPYYGTYTYVAPEVPEETEAPTEEPELPIVTPDEPETEEPTDAPVVEEEYITVYFSNNWKWTEVKIHYFGSAFAAETAWPGVAMTYVEKNSGGEEVYKATIPADASIVITGIKNDGSGDLDKTPDITEGIVDGIGYYMKWEDGNAVGTYTYVPSTPVEPEVTPDEPTTEEPTEEPSEEPEQPVVTPDEPILPTVVTVYAINSAKWTKLSAYCWTADGKDNTWPGVEMEKTDEQINGFDVYALSFASEYVNIIFNNGNNGSQTANLTVQDGQYFDIKAGKWYATAEDVPAVDPLASDIFLAGSFNSWSATATEFKLIEEGSAISEIKLDLEAGTYEFKIVRNGTWTAPKTATTITESITGLVFSSSGQDNVKLVVAEAGTYTFTWNDSKLAVTYPGTEVPEDPASPDEPVVPDTTVKIAGSFTEWKQTEMTADETGKIFTIEGIRLEKGTYEFKIVEFGTWMGNKGTIENTADGWTFKAKDADGNDLPNCKLTTKGGVYTFVFDTETDKLTVTAVLDVITYDVTWNEGNFTVNAPASIDEATDLTFTVDAAEGYVVSAVIVDMQILTAVDGVYTIANVQGNVNILVITSEVVSEPEVMTFTVTFVDKDGNVLATEVVEYGQAATAPEAPAVDGYNFVAWDTAFDYVTKDITVKATYKKISAPIVPATTGRLRIELAGGTSFTIAVNDGAARPQGASYTNTKMTIGATVTLVANTTGDAAFIGWMDEAGVIRSTTDTLTFVTTGNDYYKAVYATEVEGVNLVTFKNTKAASGNGQILDMQYYTAGDEIVFPDAPAQAGYDFTGWSMTAEQIQAALAAGQDVTVEATWELAKVYVAITVNGGKITAGAITNGQGLAYNAYTVTADAAPAGQKFAYWVDANGKVMSYLETYKFYPATDIALTAVYVAEDETVAKKELVQVSGDPTTAGTKIAYTIAWEVDASFGTVTNYGVVFVNEKDYNADTFYHGSGDTKLFDRAVSAAGLPGVTTLTLSDRQGIAYDNTYIIKAFIIYTDATTGQSVTVYSDELATYKPAP